MKTNTFVVAAAAVVAAGLFTAGDAIAQKKLYKLGSLPPGTDWFLVNTAWTKVVNKHVPNVEIRITATGPATRHGVLVMQNKMDFTGWAAIVHRRIQEGKRPFNRIKNGKELAKNIGMIFAFPGGLLHRVVYADSGIKSLQDLKGKKVFIGPPGSAAARNNTLTIKAQTGYTPGKDFEIIKMGWGPAQNAFLDRKFDVYYAPNGNPPTSQVQQVALTNKIRLLGLDPKLNNTPGMQAFLKEPNQFTAQIDPKAYGKNVVNTEPVHTTKLVLGPVYQDDDGCRSGLPHDQGVLGKSRRGSCHRPEAKKYRQQGGGASARGRPHPPGGETLL